MTEEALMPPFADVTDVRILTHPATKQQQKQQAVSVSGLKINDLSVYWFPTLVALFHSVHKAKVVLQAV